MNQSEEVIQRYTRDIHRFLGLETLTNADLRRIVDQIYVNRDGNVEVMPKNLELFSKEAEVCLE